LNAILIAHAFARRRLRYEHDLFPAFHHHFVNGPFFSDPCRRRDHPHTRERGENRESRGRNEGCARHSGEGGQADWVKGYDLAKYSGTVKRDGVQALIDLLMGSKEPITLICIGPLPTIAAALEREPRIAGHARFVGMDGSVRKGYGGKKDPDPEWNIKAGIPAAQRAFTAARPMTMTPLDT
jgi:inosine-uridine nucleoside N-ribohydrolase